MTLSLYHMWYNSHVIDIIHKVSPGPSPYNTCDITRVGQNSISAPYTTVYLVISMSRMPCINRVYMVLAKPSDITFDPQVMTCTPESLPSIPSYIIHNLSPGSLLILYLLVILSTSLHVIYKCAVKGLYRYQARHRTALHVLHKYSPVSLGLYQHQAYYRTYFTSDHLGLYY